MIPSHSSMMSTYTDHKWRQCSSRVVIGSGRSIGDHVTCYSDDTCCYRQEIHASESSRWYDESRTDIILMLPTHPNAISGGMATRLKNQLHPGWCKWHHILQLKHGDILCWLRIICFFSLPGSPLLFFTPLSPNSTWAQIKYDHVWL
jgi:hypothetical protein